MSNLDVSRTAKDWKKSTHHGAGEWLAERFTSLVLIPLTLWCVWAACQVVNHPLDEVRAFVATPLNAGLLAATILITVWHMYMGLKVIVDDYLAGPMRGFVMFLIVILCLAVLAGSGGALWCVHTGSLSLGAA